MKNKKLYIGLLCIVTIFISTINVRAMGTVQVESSTSTENKIICDATIDDDFADDCVIFAINKELSKSDPEFTPEDFKNIEIAEIRRITSGIGELTTASTTQEEAERKAKTLALTNIENFHHIYEIKLKNPGKETVLKTIREIEKIDYIEIASPNYFFTIPEESYSNENIILSDYERVSGMVQSTANVSTDLNNRQYALNIIDATSAWDIATGNEPVRVGIIDSGISNHPDLSDNLASGWDFYNNDSDTTDDEAGHGTRVAGIIGANGYVIGVAQNVSLVPLQVTFPKETASGKIEYKADGLAVGEAIDYARNNDIPVINCSFGDYNEFPIYRTKLSNYEGLIVCSAGNGDNSGNPINTDNCVYTPSGLPFENIISVAATTQNDLLYSKSNYGASTVDLAAPGDNIYSTCPTNTHDYRSGTSSAAPYVTGVAALLMSKFPKPDSMEHRAYSVYIKNVILDNVDEIEALSGKCVTGGRLNAYKALINCNQSFIIKYNANGGLGSMDNSVIVYDVPTQTRLNEFTREGYDFDCWFAKRASDNKWRYQNPADTAQTGWYLEGSQPSGWTKFRYENGVTVSRTSSVGGDVVTFYAQWKKYYTVVYDASGASGSMASTQFYCGTQNRLPQNTYTKNGYDFDCWYAERYSDHKWKYGDNSGQSDWYTMGEQPSWWDMYRYEDRGFIAETDVADNEKINLHAQWKKYFIIRYYENDGTVTMADTKVYYGVSTQLRPINYTRAGYTFDCWYVYRESDNKWRYRNPDNTSQSGFYVAGQQPDGWVKYRYVDAGYISATSSVAGDTVRLYAQWKKHFFIHYDANGGLGSMPATKVVYGEQTYLSPNTFTRDGFEFLFWYAKRSSDNTWRYRSPDEESSGWYLEGQQPEGWTKYPYYDAGWVARTASNPGEIVTLYAQWRLTYRIRYDANGGEGTMPDTVGYIIDGESGIIQLPECTFTREGYDFGGWYIYDAIYEVWAYTENGNVVEWYPEGEAPDGYYKDIINDQSDYNVANDEPITHILFAVWLEK